MYQNVTHVQSDCFCSLNLLFCGVVVAVAVVVAQTPYSLLKETCGPIG